jgi:serine/threonine protein kinase
MLIQRGFMIALTGIAIQDKIYESANSLVYRGITDDGLKIVIKMLKQDYPSPQELTRYRQEYQITRSLNLEGVIKAYSQRDCQRTLIILLEDFGEVQKMIDPAIIRVILRHGSYASSFLPPTDRSPQSFIR